MAERKTAKQMNEERRLVKQRQKRGTGLNKGGQVEGFSLQTARKDRQKHDNWLAAKAAEQERHRKLFEARVDLQLENSRKGWVTLKYADDQGLYREVKLRVALDQFQHYIVMEKRDGSELSFLKRKPQKPCTSITSNKSVSSSMPMAIGATVGAAGS